MEISGGLQLGNWNFPVVAPSSKADVTTTIQLRVFPQPHRKD
jgi:hypothetical protein